MTLSAILKQREIKCPLAIVLPTSLLVAERNQGLFTSSSLCLKDCPPEMPTLCLFNSHFIRKASLTALCKEPRSSQPQYALSSAFPALFFHSTYYHLILHLPVVYMHEDASSLGRRMYCCISVAYDDA